MKTPLHWFLVLIVSLAGCESAVPVGSVSPQPPPTIAPESIDDTVLPEDSARQIIDLIKGGSCLFVFADDSTYRSKSEFVVR